MKLVAVTILVVGMLCNSTLANAEGPVPFKSLMQTAGAQPGALAMSDAQDKSTTVPTPPPRGPRTSGGKTMIGVGIGMVVIGGGVICMTGILHDWATTSRKAALYSGGGAVAAGGITLIILGNHRRSAK